MKFQKGDILCFRYDAKILTDDKFEFENIIRFGIKYYTKFYHILQKILKVFGKYPTINFEDLAKEIKYLNTEVKHILERNTYTHTGIVREIKKDKILIQEALGTKGKVISSYYDFKFLKDLKKQDRLFICRIRKPTQQIEKDLDKIFKYYEGTKYDYVNQFKKVVAKKRIKNNKVVCCSEVNYNVWDFTFFEEKLFNEFKMYLIEKHKLEKKFSVENFNIIGEHILPQDFYLFFNNKNIYK